MGKLTQFTIKLNQNVYYAGQWVQGQVIVNLSDDMEMRGIHLEFYGGANVHWTEKHYVWVGKARHREIRHFKTNETYFNNRILLQHNHTGMSSASSVHPAGLFTYPVEFQLPASLPSTFEGKHGRVRYFVRCVIDRPSDCVCITKRAFTVISQLDLNTIPHILNPLEGQKSKTLCFWCCASNPIEATVRLDRVGYVPGEDVVINAEVTNGSTRKIESIKAQLIQKTTYRVNRKTKTRTALVAELKKGSVEGGNSVLWTSEALRIPPLPPSHLLGCKLIDIKYTFKFVVDPTGPAYDLEIPLTVVIGTIPLQTFFDTYSAAAANAGSGAVTNMGLEPPSAAGYADPAPPYGPPYTPPYAPPGAPPGAPPPSYQECVFGKVDINNDDDDDDTENTLGDTTYAPFYPYYSWDDAIYSLPEQPHDED